MELKDVVKLVDRQSLPRRFIAPTRSEIQETSPWQYLNKVWDFDSSISIIDWKREPDVPESVASAYLHMHNMGNEYGPWLESKLGYWASRNAQIRESDPTGEHI